MIYRRQLILFSVLVLLGLTGDPTRGIAAEVGAELFSNAPVRRIQITISTNGIAALRNNSRQDVSATVREGGSTFENVGVHLKGSVGSFRGIDGKPALTLSFDKVALGQRFHGLRKIHLNNSVEDPSYINELLGSDAFNAAGVPASRVTHAVVELNGRRLGLYVLKEGFTEDFLALHFRHTSGNLYEIARDAHDVDEPMDKVLGLNPNNRGDLEALAAAAEEPDLARRWGRLQTTLDVERFLSFMALEVMLGHRDGYCLARNNFRVYHDVDSGRLVFFPHGMDVLFGNPRLPIEPRMFGLAARAIMETPEGRRAHRARCAMLLTNVFVVKKMNERIDAAAVVLRPALLHDEVIALDLEVAALKGRIVARASEIERQLSEPPLELVRFTGGVAKLSGWRPFDLPEGGGLIQTATADGKQALAIQAGPVTAAAWRSKVLLPPGRYTFEGVVSTKSVAPLSFGKNHGATLRVSGVTAPRPAGLVGDQAWKTLKVPFQTTAREQEVELVCDLRASRGTAYFAIDSLRLIREP